MLPSGLSNELLFISDMIAAISTAAAGGLAGRRAFASSSSCRAVSSLSSTSAVAAGFGWLLGGLLRKNMAKEMGKLHQEFKYYMENGEVHPRKAKELAKK